MYFNFMYESNHTSTFLFDPFAIKETLECPFSNASQIHNNNFYTANFVFPPLRRYLFHNQ